METTKQRTSPRGMDNLGIDSTLPHYPEDERYTIGVSLTFERAAVEVASRLDSEDYFIPFNQKAFKAIQSLVDRGEGVTLHSLAQEIKSQLDPEEQDNPFEVATSFELASAFSLEEYKDVRGISSSVTRLKEARAYREVYNACKEVAPLAKRRSKPLEELLGIFEESARAVIHTRKRGTVTMWESMEEIEKLYDDMAEGKLVAMSTGIPELDRLLYGNGVWGGDNVVVAGETSSGKTTLALNIVSNAAMVGVKSLYFSREMKKAKLITRIHSRLAKVPHWKIRPNMDAYGEGIRERLRRTIGLVANLPITWDDTSSDIGTIRRVAKDHVRNEGVQLIALDYLKLIRPRKGFKGTTPERISAISWEIKEMAQELNVPVINICQLRRFTSDDTAKKKGEEPPKLREPQLDMLKDTGDVENDADTAIFIWRDKTEVKEGVRNQLVDTFVKVAKQRQGELGRFKLKFAPDIYSFISPEMIREAEDRAKTNFYESERVTNG